MSGEDATTVAGIILIVLDIFTVAGRFYSRWSSKAGSGWDDWTILLAVITGILPGALTIWASSVSATGPAAASNLDPNYVYTPENVLYTKITFSTTLLYFLCTSTIKLSLLLLLHRLFAASQSFRIKIYITMGAVAAFWFGSSLSDLLNCIPLRNTWLNGKADPKYCFNYNTFWLVTGIFESAIDVVILALPFTMVFTLQLDRSKKYGVAGIFLLGGLVLFYGVAKIVLSFHRGTREPNFGRAALWTTIHLYTGILCANLPASRPLFNAVARLSSDSWSKLSSFGKRFYSVNHSRSFTERDNESDMQSRKGNWVYEHSPEEAGGDCEMGTYGQHNRTSRDDAKSTVKQHVREYRSTPRDGSLSS